MQPLMSKIDLRNPPNAVTQPKAKPGEPMADGTGGAAFFPSRRWANIQTNMANELTARGLIIGVFLRLVFTAANV